MRRYAMVLMVLVAGVALAGCGKGEEGEKAEQGEGSSTGRSLGTQQVGPYSVTVTQQSDFKPGGKTKFFIKPEGGQGEPTAVRAWYGVESAEGSLKGKAGFDAADGDYDAVVEIPATPAADAKLWVEIEAAGAKSTAGFAVPK
jgi:hypothetical protein